jgi:hypothetical protein
MDLQFFTTGNAPDSSNRCPFSHQWTLLPGQTRVVSRMVSANGIYLLSSGTRPLLKHGRGICQFLTDHEGDLDLCGKLTSSESILRFPINVAFEASPRMFWGGWLSFISEKIPVSIQQYLIQLQGKRGTTSSYDPQLYCKCESRFLNTSAWTVPSTIQSQLIETIIRKRCDLLPPSCA